MNEGEAAEEGANILNKIKGQKQDVAKVGQEQIHGLLFGNKLSWQAIIYDLINTEQLDPWDVDISLLANKYLSRIKDLEEHNFFISSKVLLAAALLLRIKSEILLDEDLKSLDDVLFGRKEEGKRYAQERIELDEDIPGLIPRTPLPRFRKVGLQELMSALGKAINTETRRIRRVIVGKQYEIEMAVAMPKQTINLHEKIKDVYASLKTIFSSRDERLAFSEFAGCEGRERIHTFVPLLHLDTQRKVWLEQEGHLEEIWILLREMYEKQNAEVLEKMKKEVEAELENLSENLTEEEKERAEEIEKSFDNPLGDF
jgi:segregation and condensation protein A